MSEEEVRGHILMPCGKTWEEALKKAAQFHERICKDKNDGGDPLRVVIEWAPGSEGFAAQWEFRDDGKSKAGPNKKAVAKRVAGILAKGLKDVRPS